MDRQMIDQLRDGTSKDECRRRCRRGGILHAGFAVITSDHILAPMALILVTVGSYVVANACSPEEEGDANATASELVAVLKKNPIVVSNSSSRIVDEALLRTQLQALDKLGQLGEDANKATPQLLHLAKNGHPLLKLRAVNALGKIGSPVDPIVTALVTMTKKRGLMRFNAVRALGNMGARASKARPVLLRLIEDETAGPRVRCSALDALVKIGIEDDRTIHVFTPLLLDTQVAGRAAFHLNQRKSLCEAIPAATVVEGILKSTEDRKSIISLMSLARSADPNRTKTVKLLRKAVRDRKEWRTAGAKALAHFGRNGLKTLQELARDGNAPVRGAVAAGLGEFEWVKEDEREKAGSELLRMAVKDSAENVRKHARVALRKLRPRGETFVALLEELSRSESARCRKHVVRLVSADSKILQHRDRIDIIVKAMEDESPEVRREAAVQAGRYRFFTSKLIKGLGVLVKDKKPNVRKAASKALKQLTSNDTGHKTKPPS
jgi:HEAT repeat protein